jgi:hypothetical protein
VSVPIHQKSWSWYFSLIDDPEKARTVWSLEIGEDLGAELLAKVERAAGLAVLRHRAIEAILIVCDEVTGYR